MTKVRSFLTYLMTIIPHLENESVSPGIGLMKRRLPTEKEAIPVAVAGVMQRYGVSADQVKTLETKYDDDAGDWYVALGFTEKRAIVKMDSIQGTITEIREI